MRRYEMFAVLAVMLAASGTVAQPAAEPEVVLQLGHADGVTSVAWSTDGKRILTASRDKTAKMWDADKGTLICTLKGHTDVVTSLAPSPDGTRLLTGSSDKTAKVWDTSKCTELLTLKGHTGAISSATWSPDGKHILTGSWDDTAKVWDATTGIELFILKGHTSFVTSVAWSPDGKLILTGSLDNTAKIWDAEKGTMHLSLKGHEKPLRYVAWSPDGKRIITSSDDKAVKIWDVQTGAELLNRQYTNAMSVAWSPDGKRILTGSNDGSAQVWEAAKGSSVLSLGRSSFFFKSGHTDGIASVAWSSDGKRILTGSGDRSAKVWDAEKGTLLFTLKGRESWFGDVSWSPDGKRILTEGADCTVKVWDTDRGTDPFTLKGHTSLVRSVVWSPDGKRILTGSWDNKVNVWDPQTGTILLSLKGTTTPVNSVSWSPDGKRILTGSNDDTAKVWEADKGTEILSLKGHKSYVNSVSWSPDGKRILTGSLDSTAIIWDAKTGTALLTLKGHLEPVNSVSWSPDGKRILTGSGGALDSSAKVWDADTGAELHTLKGHTNHVLRVAWSPDGKRILTGSWDNTTKVWDAERGLVLFSLKGHTQGVTSSAWSPDGKRILTGSTDGSFRLWDAATGSELCTIFSLSENDWLVINSDGLFDGSRGGREKVHFRVGTGLTVLPVDRFLDGYWQPGLLARIMAGERPVPKGNFPVVAPPTLRFIEPRQAVTTDQAYLNVTVEASDEGGGVNGPFLFHQGIKLHAHDAEEKLGKVMRRTYRNVQLVEGKNVFTIKASSKENVESDPASLTVTFDKPPVKPDLWVVAVGVGKYAEGPLKFPANDASRLLDLFKKQGQGTLYGTVHATLLLDEQATKVRLIDALKAAQRANSRDTFLLFLSGHGVSVEGRYYFLPHEFRVRADQSADDQVRAQGVPADLLMEHLGKIPATKKVLILDTCNAGAAIQILEKLRGKNDPARLKREVELLYRATGIHILTAAPDGREAKEPDALQHGVLTYALLAAFGAVDRGPLRGQALQPLGGGELVDVDEWFKYASKRVPEVVREYRLAEQQPVISTESSGGFPILPAPKQ